MGSGPARRGAANGENGGGAEAVEDPANKNHAADQLGKFSSARQHGRPHAESHDSEGGGAKSLVHDREIFEQEIVIGHGVKDTRRCKDNAVRGAECGDQDGKRDKFAGPGTEDLANGSGGDGSAGGGPRAAQTRAGDENGKRVHTRAEARSSKKN